MAKLPQNTPRWFASILNLIVIAIMVGLGLFAKAIPLEYVIGFGVGFWFCYLMARYVHGVWLFND